MTSRRSVENTFYTAVGLGRPRLPAAPGPPPGAEAVAHARSSTTPAWRSTTGCKTVEERLSDLDDRFDEAYESVEPHVPEPAREPARQAVALAREARHQFFEMVEATTRPQRMTS